LVLGVWRSGARATVDRPRSADDLLSERFARGELTRQQYQEALVDILKDRYVRGEVDLEGYEAHLALLLGEEHPRLEEAQARAPRRESSGEH
ncbi:MAG: SHOCT domain-containing protein, partial [Chloroflexi bacterium]|nr:SHOCT domain-containing protein [Chloroflexota bacterium]